MTSALRGVDVSTWQHPDNAPIDWKAAYGDGIRFAVVKCSQGVDYVNPWFERDVADARAAGLFLGAYHFAAIGNGTAEEQGQWFLNHLSSERLELGAYLDWEPVGPTVYEAAAWIREFRAVVETTRKPCGLYIDDSWWGELRGANQTIGRLWLADWSGEDSHGALITQGEPGWVKGVEGEVDTDVLHNLRSLNLSTSPPPPPPKPGSLMDRLAAKPPPASLNDPNGPIASEPVEAQTT